MTKAKIAESDIDKVTFFSNRVLAYDVRYEANTMSPLVKETCMNQTRESVPINIIVTLFHNLPKPMSSSSSSDSSFFFSSFFSSLAAAGAAAAAGAISTETELEIDPLPCGMELEREFRLRGVC